MAAQAELEPRRSWRCAVPAAPWHGCEQPPVVFCRKLCQPQNSSAFQGEAPSLSPPKDTLNSSSPPQVGDPPPSPWVPVLLMDLAAGSRLSCACLHPVITCCRVRRSWGFYFSFIKLQAHSGFPQHLFLLWTWLRESLWGGSPTRRLRFSFKG